MKEKTDKKVKFEAATVEGAIQKALKELNCDRDELRIKVVSEEKRGLFGMEGADPAKIIVYKK